MNGFGKVSLLLMLSYLIKPRYGIVRVKEVRLSESTQRNVMFLKVIRG
jgi:hypothetical protein